MRRLPPLSSLRAFEAAARHRSFKRAAEELGVTPSAVSHQINTLEDQLRFKLFERRTREVALTTEAEMLYPVLKDSFDTIAKALDRLKIDKARRSVTISATTAFTAKWLVPRVARFQAAHPDIDLQLLASDGVVDLDTNGVDLAVRYGRGPYLGLISQPFLEDCFGPVVNPSLGVRTPEDMRQAPLIHFAWKRADPLNPTWNSWFLAAGAEMAPGKAQLTFSDESHAIQAAVAGQGVALLSLALVADELAAGRLVQPFGPRVQGMTYHLVESSNGGRSPEAAATRNWLLAEAENSRAYEASIPPPPS